MHHVHPVREHGVVRLQQAAPVPQRKQGAVDPARGERHADRPGGRQDSNEPNARPGRQRARAGNDGQVPAALEQAGAELERDPFHSADRSDVRCDQCQGLLRHRRQLTCRSPSAVRRERGDARTGSSSRRWTAALVRRRDEEHVPCGHGDQLHIEPERPTLDVVAIELHLVGPVDGARSGSSQPGAMRPRSRSAAKRPFCAGAGPERRSPSRRGPGGGRGSRAIPRPDRGLCGASAGPGPPSRSP